MHIPQPCKIDFVASDLLRITLDDGLTFTVHRQVVAENGYVQPYHLSSAYANRGVQS